MSTLSTLFKAVLILPVALVVILLAIANRGPVQLSLDPFASGAPDVAITLPLYALLLATLVLGIVAGGFAAWLSGSRHRRAGRLSRREARRLRAEADRLRTKLDTTVRTPALPAPGRPA